jgi:hypothetical protein
MKEGIKWSGICEKHCIYLRNINAKYYWLGFPSSTRLLIWYRKAGEMKKLR